ncbi:PAS domain-containing sensor histidine kinase [Poseidonocella sp. HB161398]|uniref:hybrid sensor histidine kinase/response regulator n=1 Tax=Poseidonocella sp. HB161398 TaxID=2320855 RepID=UPI0014866BA7|nr:PAS domain-containing sensor histidine kinase [Poseidonocella sp. HB161398]
MGVLDPASLTTCGLVSVASDGVIQEANAAFLAWLGRSRSEVVGQMRLQDRFTPGGRLYFQTHLLPMLRLNGEIAASAINMLPDAPESVLLSARSDPEGGGAAFVLMPAVERLRREARLTERVAQSRQKESWLAQIETLADIGAWAVTLPDMKLHWSDAVFRLHGLPVGNEPDLETALGYYADPADRERAAARFAAVVDQGATVEVEARIVTADGRLRNVRSHARPVWHQGRIIRVDGLFQDITPQREAEAARDQAVTRLSGMAENLPGVLLTVEKPARGPARIAYVSSRCREFWGLPPEELSRDIALLDRPGPEGTPAGLSATITAALERGLPLADRFRITDPAGTERWLSLCGSVTGAGGGWVRADCIILDITAEVEAEAQLERQSALIRHVQKSESLGQLTGGMAHDFNNILAVILGNLELLRAGDGADDEVALIDAALAATERGAGLTRSLLAFARKAPLAPAICDLNQIVRDTRDWTGRTLPAHLAIETSLLEGLWPVEVDVDSTASALLNLLVNARDAMPDGGSLTIETANVRIDDDYVTERFDEVPSGRYVMLSVSDTGLGIAPEVLPHIFVPFYTTKPVGRGSGLGLSMVEGFMKQSGGTIRVYSEPGKGTTFKLYFPARPGSGAVPAPLPREAVRGGGRRVLLAEDESALRTLLVRTLEAAGYQVITAASGDMAADIFAEDPGCDLLLTDIVMPGKLQGPGLARALRRLRPELPVVFMSGYAAEAAVHGNGLEPDDIRLTKPVRRGDLIAALERALASRRQGGR